MASRNVAESKRPAVVNFESAMATPIAPRLNAFHHEYRSISSQWLAIVMSKHVDQISHADRLVVHVLARSMGRAMAGFLPFIPVGLCHGIVGSFIFQAPQR